MAQEIKMVIGHEYTWQSRPTGPVRTGLLLAELEPLELLVRVLAKKRPGTANARIKSTLMSEERRWLFEVREPTNLDYHALPTRTFKPLSVKIKEEQGERA